MPALKNQRQEMFCQALAKGKTADEAYVLAGYKENRGNASTLKANQIIADRVAELLTRAATRVEITQAKVLEELAKIGFSNMLDYLKINSFGEPTVDFSTLDRDKATAIQEVTVDTRSEREGDETILVRRVRFKLLDKRAALVDIGKHLGMFIDRTDFRIVNEFDKLTDVELAQRLVDVGQQLLLAGPVIENEE